MKYKPWTEDEIKKLKELYPHASRDEIVQALPDRSWWGSIVCKASALGLKRRNWTVDEIKKLKKIWPIATSKEETLSQFPGRNWASIRLKASRLQLKKSLLLPKITYNFSEADKTWIGAAIDFEGTIGIKRTKYNLYPYIEISNTFLQLIIKFSNLTGFPIHGNIEKRVNRKPRYRCIARGYREIYYFLREIRDYLIAKQKHADLVIKFIEIYNTLKQDNKWGRVKINNELLEIYEKIKELNKRGGSPLELECHICGFKKPRELWSEFFKHIKEHIDRGEYLEGMSL
jgi:hypothetical protein